MAFGAFYLDASGEGAVGTVGEIGFIDDSDHKLTSSKITKLIELLNQGIFLERITRQGIQNTPQGHVNFIPLLGFDKAHLVEGR